jgi:hypothetical protein
MNHRLHEMEKRLGTRKPAQQLIASQGENKVEEEMEEQDVTERSGAEV